MKAMRFTKPCGSYQLCFVASVLMGASLSVQAKDLAKVNNTAITESDLLQSIPALNAAQRESFLKDPNNKRDVLQGIIHRELLFQESEKLKLDQDPEFKSAMTLYKKQLLANALLERKVAPDLTTRAIKKYWESHPDQFNTDRVHVQHILLKTEDEAKKMLTLVKDSKNDFMELAEKSSLDPSAKNNRGDLGVITRDRLDPEFTRAAFAASKGQVVGPVRTLYGYHVIKVVDKKVGKVFDFEEVELQAREALKQQLIANYIENLKLNSKVNIID